MKGILYYQKEADRNGKHYWRGEDALPYVCDDFLFVADGMGGSGNFCHDSAVPELMYHDGRIGLIFGQSASPDATLVDYVANSFRELDAMQEYYHENPDYKKHSAYFASRLIGAIALDLFRNDPEMQVQELYRRMDAAAEMHARQRQAEEYAQKLAEKLRVRLKEVAERANLTRENAKPRHLLLPTTFACALYKQTGDDYVEVICLWAGDSRVCALLPEGAVQLTVDDERNEVLTNMISLDVDFHINLKVYRFKKPFALFAVSDGCFDAMPSTLVFENEVLLQPFMNDSFEETQKAWCDLFGYASYDDSATIAFYGFGLENPLEMRKFVQNRYKWIEENYLSRLPDLLKQNYRNSLNKCKKDFSARFDEIKDRFLDEEAVLSYAAKKEREILKQARDAKLMEFDIRMRELQRKKAAQYSEQKAFLEENWFMLREDNGQGTGQGLFQWGYDGDKCSEKIKKTKRRIEESAEEFKEEMDSLNQKMENVSSTLLKQMNAFRRTLDVAETLKPDTQMQDSLIRCVREFKDYLEMTNQITNSNHKRQRENAEAKDRFMSLHRKLVEIEKDRIEKIASEIQLGQMPACASAWSKKHREIVLKHMEKAQELEKDISKAAAAEEEYIRDEARGYLRVKYAETLKVFTEQRMAELSPEMQTLIQGKIGTYHKDIEDLEAAHTKQLEIFAENERRYAGMLSTEE